MCQAVCEFSGGHVSAGSSVLARPKNRQSPEEGMHCMVVALYVPGFGQE